MAATQEDIVRIIEHRLTVWNMLDGLIEKHGKETVEYAIADSASFYAGCEEIGSSDANYFADSAVRSLGEPSIFERK